MDNLNFPREQSDNGRNEVGPWYLSYVIDMQLMKAVDQVNDHLEDLYKNGNKVESVSPLTMPTEDGLAHMFFVASRRPVGQISDKETSS